MKRNSYLSRITDRFTYTWENRELMGVKSIIQFFIRSATAFTASASTWGIAFFALGQTFLMSSTIALIGGGAAYIGVKQIQHHQNLRQYGLTRREYKYIEKSLKEARQKISRLQKALWRVRSIDQAKLNIEILRTVKKIYANTKKDPKRFYKAENFYYKHLDSLVEIAEKYAFLSSQPVKTKDISESLRDTRITIYKLGETTKKDLYDMLDDDIDTLQFELDVAKRSIQSNKRLTKNNNGRTT